MRVKFFCATLASLSYCMLASGQPATGTVTADENGNGTIKFDGNPTSSLPFTTTSGLFYILPGSTTLGQVIMTDGGGVSDIIQFGILGNGSPGFFFYSDNNDSDGDLADGALPAVVAGSPTFAEGSGTLTYTPTSGQPGFNPAVTVTYNFQSDLDGTGVPDGGTTMALLGIGLAGIAGVRRRFGC